MNTLSPIFWPLTNVCSASGHAIVTAAIVPVSPSFLVNPPQAEPLWNRLSSWLQQTPLILREAAISWLGLRYDLSARLPVIISAMMATGSIPTDIDGDGFSFGADVSATSFVGGTGPAGPEPENESIQETASLLLDEVSAGHCRKLCASLQWLTSEEMAQVMRRVSEKDRPEQILERLSLIAAQASTEHEYLLLFQLLSTALSVPRYSGSWVMKALDDTSQRLPVNGKREATWKAWEASLTEALDSWNSRDPSGAARIDGLLASIRSSSWRTGYPSPVIDRLIDFSPSLNPQRRDLNRHFLFSAGHIVRRRNEDHGLVRRFLEIQYVADRIAASGDLVRAKVILSEAIQNVRSIERETPSIHASYITRRLQFLHDGILTAIDLIAHLDVRSLDEAVSLYRSPDYLQLPPVHIVVRGLRRNASLRSARGKISGEPLARIHAAARELVKLRILDPVLGDLIDQGDGAILNLHQRLLEGIGRGDEFSGEDWGALLAEAADLLNNRGLLSEAHDLLRAFHKMDACEARAFSSLAMGLVTNAEILLHKTVDPAARENISRIRDRLVEWHETLDG